MAGKVQDVAHGRRAKRVDRLRVVADHGEPAAVRLAAPAGSKPAACWCPDIRRPARDRSAPPDLVGDRGLLHHVRPVEQQVVVIEHVLLLLGLDIGGEQRSQLVLPPRAPRKVRAREPLRAAFRCSPRANRSTRQVPLAGKRFSVSEKPRSWRTRFIRSAGILAVVDGEAGRKPDRFGVFAQQPRADGVEGAGPSHAPRPSRRGARRATARAGSARPGGSFPPPPAAKTSAA